MTYTDPHDLKLPVPDEIYASLESLAVTKNLPKSEPADELSPPINEQFIGEISDNENDKKPFRERTNIGENHVRKSRSKSVVSYSRAKPKKVTIKGMWIKSQKRCYSITKNCLSVCPSINNYIHSFNAALLKDTTIFVILIDLWICS